MIRKILFVAALAACHHVRACDCTLPSNYGNKQCAAAITAALKGANASTSSASQSQTQGQYQTAAGGASTSTAQGGQGGRSQSSSNSSSTGGSVSGVSAASTGGTIDYAPESTTNVAAARIPANTAVAGFQLTTAPCRYAEGLGVQTTPAGGSIGFTFKDHDCMRFQLAQILYARGQDVAADRLMCEIGELKHALGVNCIALLHVDLPAPAINLMPPARQERMYTQSEVDAIARKLVSK